MAELSIIVPVYNVASYLSKCIGSIISQSFEDWELILIDDGSSDDSAKICLSYAHADKRIRVLCVRNAGVSNARNLGMAVATGTYIAFIDSDDWIDSKMYESMLPFMSDGVDIVFCRFTREYDEHTVLQNEQELQELCEVPYDLGHIIYEKKYCADNRQTLTNYVFGSVWRSVFNKELIDSNHISFPRGIKVAEDRLFLMQYLSYCNKAKLVDEYFYHYRERNGSVVLTNTTGYQCNLYNRKKSMLEREFTIIERCSRLSKDEKKKLVTYERCQFCFDVVINELLYNKQYNQKLKEIFQDRFMRDSLTLSSFSLMLRNGTDKVRIGSYVLIKFHMWDAMHFLLCNRRGNINVKR